MVPVTKTTIFQNARIKAFRSFAYNYTFDLRSGNFRRWGHKPEKDPVWSPFGPELVDIEISAGGGCPMRCSFCYKGNGTGGTPTNMSFSTFKSIFDKLPHVVSKTGQKIFFTTQIAFGITSVGANPDLFEIFDYCRQHSVIPNVTINGMDALSNETIRRLVFTCGAIAVSINKTNYHKGVQLIQRMTDYGATQINMHTVVALETINSVYDIIDGIKSDSRLSQLNAVVFLGLKPKNRGENYEVLPGTNYTALINYCLARGINFGFDSCSAPKFEEYLKTALISEERKKQLLSLSERCESGMFSAYIDANGVFWPCSFGEKHEKFPNGIDVTKAKTFLHDVWLADEMSKWRTELINKERECPLYPVINVKHNK